MMVINKYKLAVIGLLIFILTVSVACSTDADNIDKEEMYDGDKLSIGIIGDAPEIRETQIDFEEINFDSIKEDGFDSQYDAIFITKENLSQASNAEYTQVYKQASIPFYFIESDKTYVNFIKEDQAYADEPDSEHGMFIIGLFYKNNEFWEYGLYNDVKNETNIKGVFSRVFKGISENKQELE